MLHMITLPERFLRGISLLKVPMHFCLPYVEFSIVLTNEFFFNVTITNISGTSNNNGNIVLETEWYNSEQII